VLNYVTPKYVALSDRRLGLIYYILLLLILVFTVLELFLWKGYLEFDTNPHGSVRLVVSDELENPPTFSLDKLPYCSKHPSIPCHYMDSQEMTWPWDSRAITVTTHAKDKLQQVVNSASSDRDKQSKDSIDEAQASFESTGTTYKDVKKTEYFTANPEYVLVKIDHSVVATKFTDASGRESLACSHRKMVGHLYSCNGTRLRELNEWSRGYRTSDKVTVKELMGAAGLFDLEATSDAISAGNESYRERGCVIRVSIAYDNWRKTLIGTHDIEYSYYVKRLPYIDYVIKEVQPIRDMHETSHFTSSPEYRLQRKRYAVRIEFEQSGSLGKFSLSALVIKLASSVGLLTLTATMIECLALYILPGRQTYRDQIIDSTLLKRGEATMKRSDIKSN
jgi:hypothetical protein